jgi:hypothetical protein
MFHAELVTNGVDAAESVLERAPAKHSIADLYHCQMVLAALRWAEAAKEPGLAAFLPQASLRFLGGLKEAAGLVGLPFHFRDVRAGVGN